MNKTLFFSAVIFIIAAVFITTTVYAADKASLDATFKYDINNFTTSNDGKIVSGLSGGTVETTQAGSDYVTGLVFVAKLGVNTQGLDQYGAKDTITTHWTRVLHHDQAFVIKLCLTGSATQCWLNTIPYTDNRADPSKQALSATDINGNYTDSQTLSVSVFNKNDRNTGDIYSFNPSTGDLAKRDSGVPLQKGVPLTATFWYCSTGTGAQAYDEYAKLPGAKVSNPTKFGDLCNTYFQIGTPLAITIPKDDSVLTQQTTDSKTTLATGSTASSTEGSNLPECSFTVSNGLQTINGCVARIAYGIYWLIAWIAGILGNLFDFFLGYSLDSKSYTYDFAVTGWKLVRDISNIFFIILMVWTGFAAVFNVGKGGTFMRNIVAQLVINAILINFSLFATRVVIDISNITARMFYSQMVVCDTQNLSADGKCDATHAKHSEFGGYWPLSEKIVSSFNPQVIFKTSSLNPPSTVAAVDSGASFNAQEIANSANLTSKTDYANYFMVVCLVAAIIMAFVGIMFFKVAFLFVGRVVGLYMAMIFSPFAFLSRALPYFSKAKSLRWDDWLSELMSLAFMAPVFVFFLYIIFTFLSSDFVQQIGFKDSSGSFMGTVLGVAIPMLIIFFLLKAAEDSAVSMSGTIGKRIQALGEQATGLAAGAAIGIATGGVALAGTRFGARAGIALGESKLGKWAAANADNSRIARWTNTGINKTQTGSWDIRKAKVAGVDIGGALKKNQLFDRLGIQGNVNKFSDTGEKYFEGGRKGQQDRRQKEIKENMDKRFNYAHLNDDQAKATWEDHKKRELDKARAKGGENWEKYIENDAAVAPEVSRLKAIEDEAAALKTEREKLVAEELSLRSKVPSTAAEATQHAADLSQKQATLADTERKLTAKEAEKTTATAGLQTLKDLTIANHKKNGTAKNSAAYAEAASSSVTDRERELAELGNVKNNKDLAAVMKREYAEDRRNNSFWMKDGKQRKIIPVVGAGYGTAGGILAGAGAAVAGVFGAVAAERLKFEQEALDAATNSYIKDFKKNQGKESKVAQLNKKIEDYDKTVEEALVKKGHRAEDIKKWDTDRKQNEFKDHVNDVEADYDTAKARFNKAEDDFKNKRLPEADFRAASKAKKEAEDRLNKVKNIWTNKEKAQEDLAKEVDKAKEKAEKSDKKDDKK